jgi:uncharacterized protein YbdZ (MbtH family)
MKKRNGSYRMLVIGLLALTMLLLSGSLVFAGWFALSPPNVSSDWSLYGVHFTSADEGWAVGSDISNMLSKKGVLLHFVDESWTSIDPPSLVSLDWELFSVHFTSVNEGWAVGADYSNKKGVLLRYLDGSWISVNPPSINESWYLNSVYFTSATEGWAVGVNDTASVANSGVLLHYLNGSWSAVPPPYVSSNWTLNGVQFTSSGEGWAVGDNKMTLQGGGVLLHYQQNGGWTNVLPPNAGTDWDLTSVYFTSSNGGWAVGNDIQYPVQTGLLFRYNNGTWTEVRRSHSSQGWNLFSTHFVSSTEGWAVGVDIPSALTQTGLLMHYSGGTWSFVTPPEVSSDWGLAGVHFTSSDEGWAVGRDNWNGSGVLLRYSIFPEIQVTPSSIDFGNVSVGKTSEKRVTVKNMGGVNLTLDTIGSVAAPLVKSGGTCTNGKKLIPNATCTLLIEFAPDADGPFTSRLDITSDDLDTPTVTVDLAGRSGPGDLAGTWDSLTQTCNTTTSGIKCKLEGTLVVENAGYKDLSSSYVYFYLSDDGSYDLGDTYLKKKSTGKVKYDNDNIENTKSITFTYKFPKGESALGKYIIAVLDAKGKVLEVNELNNVVVSDVIP